MTVVPKGWRLAALGGNSVALEWADCAAGRWVQRLVGGHPCPAVCLPLAVYRLHSNRIEPGLTVFDGTVCLYSGSDPAGGAHALMGAMMQVWTLSCRDGLMLHAALLSRRGRGVLIGGVSGSGKSSLSGWFIQHGWAYHGDEQMYANADTGYWEGFVRPLCLKGDWASLFPAVVVPPESFASVGGQTLVPVHLLGQECQPDVRVRPGLLLFPTFRSGSEFSLQRISCGQATIQLIRGILNGGNLKNHGVAQAAAIARGCPAYELSYGSFDQLKPLLELLATFDTLPPL